MHQEAHTHAQPTPQLEAQIRLTEALQGASDILLKAAEALSSGAPVGLHIPELLCEYRDLLADAVTEAAALNEQGDIAAAAVRHHERYLKATAEANIPAGRLGKPGSGIPGRQARASQIPGTASSQADSQPSRSLRLCR